VDFGLARAALHEGEEEPTLWATPYYIAPEKVNGRPDSFSSDQYSLAGTIYHALTGHAPFERDTLEEVLRAHLITPLTPPAHLVDGVSSQTSEVLCRASSKTPADRYPTYNEFIMALTAARSQLLVEKFTRRSPSANEHANGNAAKRWWNFNTRKLCA